MIACGTRGAATRVVDGVLCHQSRADEDHHDERADGQPELRPEPTSWRAARRMHSTKANNSPGLVRQNCTTVSSAQLALRGAAGR